MLNENLLLLNFLSRFFHLVAFVWEFMFKSEQYFCTVDFCIFNLRRPVWFVCLVYLLRSNIIFWVLSSYYRTHEKRTKWALDWHSWNTIYLKIIGLFSSSFWCTTFIFLALCCIICHMAKKLSDFFFLNWFLHCVFRLHCLVFSQMLSVLVKECKFCCIRFRFVLLSQKLTRLCVFNFLGFYRVAKKKNIISCFLRSFTHQTEFYLSIFFNILALRLFNLKEAMSWNLIWCLWLLRIWLIFVLSLALKYSEKTPGN